MKTTQTTLGLLFSLSIASSANAGILYAINNDNDHLVTIDTNTLALTDVGALGTNVSFGGATYDPISEILYMIGGRGNNSLYTVDTGTGAASLVGSHGINDLFGLAFDTSTSTLYGTQFSGGQSLYSLNSSTAAASLIATMARGIGGLTYNSMIDELVGMNDGPGDLYSIDRGTGALTMLVNGDFVNDSGLAYDPDLNLYWDIDYSGYLYSYDPDNSYSRTTRLTGLGSFDGLAYRSSAPVPPVATVPEPGTLALLGIGLAGVRLSRKQKKQ